MIMAYSSCVVSITMERSLMESTADKNAVQTPLHFTKLGFGGYQNAGFMFVHYNRNNTISLINF